jgi:hypothetical protein
VTISGGSYEIKDGAVRRVTATVKSYPDAVTLASMGIELVKRGT